jgi:hypothetical protein
VAASRCLSADNLLKQHGAAGQMRAHQPLQRRERHHGPGVGDVSLSHCLGGELGGETT